MKNYCYISLLITFISMALYSCQPEPVKVTGITLNATSLTLTEGETGTIVATISPADAENKKVIWSSNNASVAAVKDGVVTAVSKGIATIVAKSDDGGFSASCNVTVESKSIRVNSIEIDPDKLTLTLGSSQQLAVDVYPSNADNKTIIWSSSDESVATVSQNGLVTAINVGSADISAKSADGNIVATSTVIVYQKVTGVSISHSELDLWPGDSFKLEGSISPAEAMYDSVEWTSDDSKIAYVNNKGHVVALKGGETKITFTVKTPSGNYSASCNVNVKQPVTGIAMVSDLQMYVGEQSTISATISPENATDKSLTWSSSDTSVAAVSSEGVVIAKSQGTAIITASSADGKSSTTCTITVKKPSIAIDKTSVTLLTGDSYQLQITCMPSILSESGLVWSTSDNSVAVVSSGGKVTAKSAGSSVITVQTVDGLVKSSCKITVTNDISLFVTASYNGGTIMKSNDLILYGSALTFSVTNNSNQSIKVLSVYMVDGSDKSKTSELSLNKSIAAKKSASWSISVPIKGIHKPTAVFTYTNNGNTFTVSAAYYDFYL